MSERSELQSQQQDGVGYSPILGGICPSCGQTKARVMRTMVMDASFVIIRYHRCANCNSRFKTIQDDPIARNYQVN